MGKLLHSRRSAQGRLRVPWAFPKGLRVFLVLLWAMATAGCGSVVTPSGTGAITPTFVTPVLPTSTPQSPTSPGSGPGGPGLIPATPTPSPTPVIYVVQEGDTLFGIAVRYGVSVEAIQRANNIANPLFLRPGQQLVIPVGQEEAMAPQELLPTPTPMPIGIRGVAFYETPVGSLHCLGEVINTTAYTLTNVQVKVTLFNAEGAPVAEGKVFASADLLPPTARAPFSLLFTAPPPNFVSHQVTLLRGEEAGELAKRYVPIQVEEVTGAPYGPQFEISGIVRNLDPNRSAVVVIVVATTYDENGLVNGFRQQKVEVGEGLAPGATAPFRMRLTVYSEKPRDFSLFAFGRAQ